MEHYITIEELRRPPFNLGENILDETLATFLLDMTQEFIDQQCKQDFWKEGDTGSEVEKRVSGTGREIVFLPKRLITLKEVNIYSSEDSAQLYTLNNFFYHPRYLQWNMLVAEASPRFPVAWFPEGIGNVGIVGIWGYPTVPTPIKYLQGRMVQKIVKEGWMTEKNDSESVGDFSRSPMMLQALVTGDAEIDTIFKRHTDTQVHVPS